MLVVLRLDCTTTGPSKEPKFLGLPASTIIDVVAFVSWMFVIVAPIL